MAVLRVLYVCVLRFFFGRVSGVLGVECFVVYELLAFLRISLVIFCMDVALLRNWRLSVSHRCFIIW